MVELGGKARNREVKLQELEQKFYLSEITRGTLLKIDLYIQ